MEVAINVLIVDDHHGYRQVATEVVDQTDGFAMVASAADRIEALERLAADAAVDLVLMDVNLGDDDGIALTTELIAQYPSLDVVLVSALRMHDLPADAATCGARAYLSKNHLSPVTLIELTNGVYDWPDGHVAGRLS